MKKKLLLFSTLCLMMTIQAKNIEIKTFRYSGALDINIPFQIDSTNVNAKAFDVKSLLDTSVKLNSFNQGKVIDANQIPDSNSEYSISLLSFNIRNNRYFKGKLKVEDLKDYQLFVDGKKIDDGTLNLEPLTHEITVKYLSKRGDKCAPKISLDTECSDDSFIITTDNTRNYSIYDVLLGKRFSGIDLSADGKYLIVNYKITREGGETSSSSNIIELATSKIIGSSVNNISWMPKSNKYYFTRKGVKGKELVVVNPLTGKESVMAEGLPEGSFVFSPTEDYFLFTQTQEGPKENKDIYQIITPDDRQPGWRDRTYLSKYDLKTGVLQPLTFGFHNVWATDISADGRYVLMFVSQERLTKRPTTLLSLYKLDVNTMKADLLIDKDGFVSNAIFSPDEKRVIVTGSPESFEGIGRNVKDGQTPSMYDYQLFSIDLSGKDIKPLTKDFNPSVQTIISCKADGGVYFTAENRDYISLYKLNPNSGKISEIKVAEDLVNNLSVSPNSTVIAYYGQGASNSDRLYTLNAKSQKSTLIEDLSKDILKDVKLGECKAWNFTNSKGDTIYGRYYLPADFDASKKYPMIVNYYGGCSPTSRNFESRYPHNAYAALGYVVYVIEPSGATGFGQEFAARHVNTAGQGVAEDIIEGTKQFVKEHSFVNDKKIGCIGASYGGFMTQYLQTQTDIFAAAISHAGISDHTSYWGEGYWGYSYSEVSMANSYPWSNADLFVKQSPLFNADKIHTPLLFLHGSADTNVPIGESIQMFNALKLLGRETAFVVVDGENHHILEYSKRLRWQNTIYAWFAKWLQDDDLWWKTIYSDKTL